MRIRVTPAEMYALARLEQECWGNLSLQGFDSQRWLEGCRGILGNRCPEPYGPPVRVEVSIA